MIDMNKSIGKLLLCLALPMGGAVAGLMLPSCSDKWDDHYATLSIGEGSIWATMSKNADVSNFQAVLEACGYADLLDGSQAFTVFAPVNDNFTATMRDSVIALYKTEKAAGVKETRNKAIKEFVMNHIALYNHSVSSLTNDSIVMMNGKYAVLKNNSFDGMRLEATNMMSSNGILYKVAGQATYLPNIYEYLGRDSDLDSVRSYIYSYSIDEFIAEQSVPGPIVDGKTQYLDSVTKLTNKLMSSWMDAELDVEDSTYWFLAPTNEVWNKIVPQYERYFQYDEKVAGRDSLMYNYPRIFALSGTTFSRTVNTDKLIQDSAAVFSTWASSFTSRVYSWGKGFNRYYIFDNPFEEGGIFENTVDVQCSNGLVKKADLANWKVDSLRTVLRSNLREGEYGGTIDSVYSVSTSDPVYYSVASNNPFYNKVSKNMFVEIAPTSTSNIKVLFDIYNVLSNVPYDVYLVAVPLTAKDTLLTPLPTKFRATLYYHDMTGKEVNFKQSVTLPTEPNKVDTVFVGTYTFPTCSMGLDDAQVKMLVQGYTSASEVRNGTGTKTLLVDCIIFKPHVSDGE